MTTPEMPAPLPPPTELGDPHLPNGEPTESPDIEGLGTAEDEQGSPYPLRDMMVRPEVRTVADVVKRINSSRYIMNPGFQRDYVWGDRRASKLIESCIMRIPLPVIYVAEGSDGRITVVDGLQRLTSFQRFLNDDFKLTKLGSDHPLDGQRFSDLSIDLQERVEDTQLTLYILDRNTPSRTRLDIFERVNGGVQLTRQQMRNALYYGPGTEWLRSMADDDLFLTATARTLRRDTMRDREVINRFAAFQLFGYKDYHTSDMDDFLARAIGTMNQEKEQLGRLQLTFTNSMRRNHDLFGVHAFRKSLAEGNQETRRVPINISLFDVLSDAFTRILDNTLASRRDEIITGVRMLLQDEEFLRAITYSTNSRRQVWTRFEMTEQVLGDFWT